MNLDNIILFDKNDKEYMLQDAKIDKGIKPLCDAINNIPYLVTMNSCQGYLFKNEAYDHCPRTYVDFYVLNHNYEKANNLFSELIKIFGSAINCSIDFEADFDIIIDEDGDECAEDNGKVKLRYSIELITVNEWNEDSKSTLQEIVDFINNF